MHAGIAGITGDIILVNQLADGHDFINDIIMKRSVNFPVMLVTSVLFVYAVLLATGWSPVLAGTLFFLSPFLVIWMVYRVLRYDSYNGKELNEEEWGYTDRRKEELNVF